ncbi:MAG: hypothetical protein V2A70_07265 [Candidatus Omnitrophota bacterium]
MRYSMGMLAFIITISCSLFAANARCQQSITDDAQMLTDDRLAIDAAADALRRDYKQLQQDIKARNVEAIKAGQARIVANKEAMAAARQKYLVDRQAAKNLPQPVVAEKTVIEIYKPDKVKKSKKHVKNTAWDDELIAIKKQQEKAMENDKSKFQTIKEGIRSVKKSLNIDN